MCVLIYKTTSKPPIFLEYSQSFRVMEKGSNYVTHTLLRSEEKKKRKTERKTHINRKSKEKPPSIFLQGEVKLSGF